MVYKVDMVFTSDFFHSILHFIQYIYSPLEKMIFEG